MTTRKQKHEAMMVKRERRLAAERAVGLKVLEKVKEERLRQELQAWQENHDKRHTSWKKRVKECPHCQIEIATSNKARRRIIEEII